MERAWFGETLPILWWDQPSASLFQSLTAHAARQLEALAEASGGQVHLIAHSFGGQIATALARQYPGLIGKITLLGCPPSPLYGFIHFARRLMAQGDKRPALLEALAAAEENCTEQRFLAICSRELISTS